MTEGSVINGFRMTFDPPVDTKIKTRCFKYWSKIWTPTEGSIVWRRKSGVANQWRMTYDGQIFTFEVYRQWLTNRGIARSRLGKALEDIEPRIHKVFVKEANKLLGPTSRLLCPEATAINRAQISLFNTDGQILQMLIMGEKLDVNRIQGFLRSIDPMFKSVGW